jgi:hypothetical protein
MATIIIKNSGTTGNVPGTLSQGEFAINVVDGRLFYGSGSGNIVKEFTGSGGGSAISASYALTASYASNGGVTQLLAGPNITLSPTNGLGQVTVSSTAGGGGFNTATGSYGSFYDTTTQTNPVANVPRSMSFDSTDITNGVSISGSTNPFNTYVKTENAGIYNIQFSAQIDKTDSGTDEIVIWLRKNEIDLTDTATTLTLSGNNDKQVAAWNWFVTSAAGDYYQIIWLSADTNLRLLAEPISGTHPGIPSVILTANRVDQFLSNTGSFSGSFNGLFTGSLFGTASWATNALTASFINTASTNAFVQGGNSFGATALLGTNDNQSLAFETSGSVRMFVSSSGNVGIGTVTPASTLSVSGRVGISARLRVGATGDPNSTMEVWGDQIFATGAGGTWSTFVQSTERLGVGTSSPSSKVHIKGAGATLATTALRVENANASASFVVRDDGKVGIGTASPAYLLDITGSDNLINISPQASGNAIVINNGGYIKWENASLDTYMRCSNGFGLSDNGFNSKFSIAFGGLSSINTGQNFSFQTGNVLVGTITDSGFKLDISGSGRFTNGLTVTGSVIASSFTGSLLGTASYATQALSASWAPSVASNPFPFTGSAIISGSLVITGSFEVGVPGANNPRITSTGTLNRGDVVSVDWISRNLQDNSAILSVDWESRVLNDAPGIVSADWASRTLNDTAAALSVDWESRFLYDSTGAKAYSYETRDLVYPNNTSALNYGTQNQIGIIGSVFVTGSLTVSGSSTFTNIGPAIFSGSVNSQGGFTGSLQGTASFATTASFLLGSVTSASFASTASFVNPLRQTVQITGSLTVTGSVISNTDGLNRLARYGTALSGSTIGTGVTAQTIVYSQLIPANTFGVNNIIRTRYRFRKLSTNANATHNIIVNTSNAVAGATTLATLTANTVHNQMKRDFHIAQGNATTTVGAAVNTATDDTTNTQLLSVINWAVDQYLIYTVTLGTTDSGYGLGYTIEQVL